MFGRTTITLGIGPHSRFTKSSAESVEILSTAQLYEQEGQQPMTGQRAANFRLLANQ